MDIVRYKDFKETVVEFEMKDLTKACSYPMTNGQKIKKGSLTMISWKFLLFDKNQNKGGGIGLRNCIGQ